MLVNSPTSVEFFETLKNLIEVRVASEFCRIYQILDLLNISENEMLPAGMFIETTLSRLDLPVINKVKIIINQLAI